MSKDLFYQERKAVILSMHEMSIAMSIVETAESHARARGAFRINEIEVEIGTLAGVMADALDFCFLSVSKGTLAEGAALKIISTPGMGECMSCGAQFPVEAGYDSCPLCEEVLIRIVKGNELKVKAIEID